MRFGDRLLKKMQDRGQVQPAPAEKIPATVSHNGPQVFSCFVPGDPKAQGGTVPFFNEKTQQYKQVTKGQQGLGKWRVAMTNAFIWARKQTGHQTYTGPVQVGAVFIMPRRKNHPKTMRGDFWHCTKPDLDKLQRAVGDSLEKAGVIISDSRITTWRPAPIKRYADLTETPGVKVSVKPLIQSDLQEVHHEELTE